MSPKAAVMTPVLDSGLSPRETAIALARTGAVLTGKELRIILRVKPSTFFYHQARGHYDKLKVKTSLGGLQIYSGALIAKWLDGDPVYAPVFGRRPRI